MIKEKADLLVAVLRSGKYKQGQYTLRTIHDEYCCLGVACEEANIKPVLVVSHYTYDSEGCYLPFSVRVEFGFYSSDGKRKDHQSLDMKNGKSYSSLSAANDDGTSFEDVADYIEANYECL